MNYRLSSLGKFSISGFIIIQSFVLAYFMRPIQDDYFNLQSVQQLGVLGYLEDTWLNHGGNMIQFLIHCIVILPTTQSFTYWNLGLFFLFTQLLCFWTIRVVFIWLLPNRNKKIFLWIPLLSLAGFEGLFVPGFLGTFGFSLAALAHLWPVMAFVIGLLHLRKSRSSWVIALLMGLVAGNSNLGESAFAIGCIFLILLAHRRINNFFVLSGIAVDRNFFALAIGVCLGTIGIVAAPGFWARASDQVGLPHSILDFGFRFIKSFASFSADAITHPMVWVIFFLGIAASKAEVIKVDDRFRFRAKILTVGTIVIWLALIMGSTFAYPSWHQSMGMYVLLFPVSFVIGVITKNALMLRFGVGLLVISAVVMTFVFLRIGVLGVQRAEAWDRNLVTNACALKLDQNAPLLGAEIRYPPFGLGVEDINTWEWMRNKYAGWIQQMPDQFNCGN
jgi:hypothetical protein